MANGTGQQRPLSEVSPVAQRRNSPSWNQSTKKMINGNSSPLDASSPFSASASPRLFWKGRESGSPFNTGAENSAPYNPEATFSVSKRASLENLKKVSRVRNSRIFAREQNNEYDPAQVYVPQRPLATGRLSQKKGQSNSGQDSQSRAGDQQAASQQHSELSASEVSQPQSPTKEQASPAKSSLSKGSRFGPKGIAFNPEHEIWLDGRRHSKSVTFDAAPPQVNEYEMSTPDPSSIASESREGSYDSEEDEEEDISFDRDLSIDRDDSFDASLEDIEKTPVVLPDDWRFMSPDSADEELVHEDEDLFTEHEHNNSPDTVQHSRVESQDSNGERRPLPPLPSTRSAGASSAGFDLGSTGQRTLPSPPGQESYDKSESSELERASISLEDKLRLMVLGGSEEGNGRQDDDEHHDEEHAIRAENHASEERKGEGTQKTNSADQEDVDAAALVDFASPRISRESILRDIRKSDSFFDDSFEYSSQIDSSPLHYTHYDPDVPIPSLENDDDYMENSVVIKDDEHDEALYAIPDYHEHHHDINTSVSIKEEEHDEDLYAIPAYHEHHHDQNPCMDNEHDVSDDDNSQYSRLSAEEYHEHSTHSKGSNDSQVTAIAEEKTEQPTGEDMTGAIQPESYKEESAAPDTTASRESLERSETPDGRYDHSPDEEPSSPESVIRHPIEDERSENECIPDPVATVKAPGGKLKTRPSLTPADIASMAATRRKISGQQPPMPFLSKQTSNESQHSAPEDAPSEPKENLQDPPPLLPPPTRNESQRQSSLVKLDIPFSIQEEESLGFGLDKEFDRVIEAQKVAFEQALSQSQSSHFSAPSGTQALHPRNSQDPSDRGFGLSADHQIPKQRGYLMRHNTKVIVASSSHVDDEPAASGDGATAGPRGAKSAGSSPRKVSQQTWTTVPWNSQARRASIKMGGSGLPRKKPVPGPVPPLPGQPSNVQEAMAAVEETDPALTETFEDGEERGRLFVKVVGTKYLDLPLPKGERSYFALTLDNGLHCVTTSWLELGKSAPIGQEFELIVQNDLEFQLTLQMKVDESKFQTPEVVISSPTRQKASTFSRVFASSRKRKEMDLKQQLIMQQQRNNNPNPGVWDRLRTLIARDGSFARAYVALSDHEKHAFGRPYTVDVSCFNEWAIEDQPSSVKSKKSTSSSCSQRRPPYKIGKLELQLLFVPKPKGAKDEDMPKSMNACIREMREAENVATRSYEGFLSQQGGDCPYWRRRFFKLQGSKLTAFHETTRQPRATINLAKAVKLIDDKSILTQKETTTKGGGRRKSAFAEEEDGYMFVEEGFRIRFGNGEVIDFYADSAVEKDGWMKVLGDTVGKGSSAGNGQAKAWTELVLKHERHLKAKRDAADRLLGSNGGGGGPPPPPPASASVSASSSSPAIRKDAVVSSSSPASARLPAQAQASHLPRPGHKHTFSQPDARSVETRRQKTRSLIF